jgi:Circadian oscillating protein COP23
MMKGIIDNSCARLRGRNVNCSKLFHTMLAAGIILSVTVNLQLSTLAKDDKFFCETEINHQGKTIPSTIARAKRGNEIRIIYWFSEYFVSSGDTPIERCKKTSQQFQKYYDNGWLKYIRTGSLNGFGVICVSRIQGGQCLTTDIITILPPNIDRVKALDNLLDLRRIVSGKPLYLSNQLITYENGEAYINFNIFLKNLSIPLVPIQANSL